MNNKLALLKRLKVKLLAIVGLAFLALIVPGIWALLLTTSLTDEEMLATRIGNLTARTRARARSSSCLQHSTSGA